MPDLETLKEMDKKLQEEKIAIAFHSYGIVMKALEMPDFKKWKEAQKDNLAFDYDYYHQNCVDNFEEPIGFDIWALGRFLEEYPTME